MQVVRAGEIYHIELQIDFRTTEFLRSEKQQHRIRRSFRSPLKLACAPCSANELVKQLT